MKQFQKLRTNIQNGYKGSNKIIVTLKKFQNKELTKTKF